MTIKRNYVVVAISGSLRGTGKTGKVLVVDREKNTALVEGFNLVKRHMKRSQDNPQGKIVEREAPVAVSNLMLYCSSCKRGVKSVRRTEGDQVRRACKRCGNTLDA